MRLKVPPDYFQTFTFFKTLNPSGRIANLPQGSFWGWTNYTWNYSGSGFLWYGLPQPILDRAFDTWNLQNEQYYWQLTTALQEKNPTALKNILDQYNIQYILFDKQVYFPDEHIYSKISVATPDILNQIPGLKKIKDIGKISIYEYLNVTSPYLISSPVSVKPFGFTYFDPAFKKYGDYVVSNQSSIIFPFTNLFTNRLQSELTFNITFDQNKMIIKDQNQIISFPLDYSANDSFNTSPLISPFQSLISHYYHLENENNENLFAINFPKASLSKSYLARIEYRHLSGLPLQISAVSNNSQNKYFDTHLDITNDWTVAWFTLPARQTDNFDSGINFILRNNSPNNIVTINDIKFITLYPIPIATTNFNTILHRQYLSSTNHLFSYQVKLPSSYSNSTLVLPQSFSPGWLAFYFDGFKPVFLQNHVLANNWSNAWEISNINNKTIYILFWPQLLEFLGFGLLIGTLIFILHRH